MSGDDDYNKWPCSRCTYLNFSTSGRCTMCSSLRPQHHIIPTAASNTSTAFSATRDEPALPPMQTCLAVSPTPGDDKWPCNQCTYLNYPRAVRCAQCYGQRMPDGSNVVSGSICSTVAQGSPTSPLQASKLSQSAISPITAQPCSPFKTPHATSVSTSTTSPLKNNQSPSHRSCQSPPLKSRQSPPLFKPRQSPPLKSRQSPPLKLHQSSPKGRRSPPRQFCSKQSTRVQGSPKAGLTTNNRVNHETQTSPSDPLLTTDNLHHFVQHKWCCPACTYANWPRSARCIMCATPKSPVVAGDVSNEVGAGDTTGRPQSPSPSEAPISSCDHDGRRNTKNASTEVLSPSRPATGDQHHAIKDFDTSCSKSIEINEIEGSDINTCASTNSTQVRVEADSVNRFIVGHNKESKLCESINIINRNRSEVNLSHRQLQESSSAINVNSKGFSVVGSSTVPAPVISQSGGGGANTCHSASPIISCATGAAVRSSLSTVAGSLVSAPHSSPNNTGGVCQPGVNNRDASNDSGVRGRGEGAMALNNYETEKLLRQLRRRLRDADLAFLNACLAVVEGNYEPVESYLSSGGDPMRKLTSSDVKLLARPSAFDEGHTLVHLAIRFGREDMLDTILSGMDSSGRGVKRVPCYVAPELANDIRRGIAASLRQRREAFPCYCVSEFVTYSLPPEVEMLGSSSAQDRLWDELLDRDAQKQLEEDAPIINWSLELTDRLGSRLYALWNRTAGDCLLDSVLQATWGVFDRDNCLRTALAASLTESAHLLYPRWKEYERLQATLLDYAVPENQVMEEWAELVCLASQPGAALDQLHIFVLAHILRRPIIVYGVKSVKSFRGEDLGFARFEGVYLPLLWDSSFCCKSPIALGYTRGHFCALVPICPQSIHAPAAGAILDPGESQLVFLPLMSHDAKLLPVHFVTQSEAGCEAALLREWLDVCQSETGLLVAQQKLHKKPLPVAQMTEEWLNYYRTMAQMEGAPFSRPITSQGYSSDGDSEEE